MPIYSDPNNMNSIFYYLIIVKYSMKTLHWYFPRATALHLYNMTGTGGKLQQLHCYHPFSDSLDIYLTKNHSENYSPKMVPIAKIWGSGSWTICLTRHLGPLLLTWFNFNPCMYKWLRQLWNVGWNPFLNVNSATVEVWEWTNNNFILHFTGHVIAYLG